jgi:hypothetical protein
VVLVTVKMKVSETWWSLTMWCTLNFKMTSENQEKKCELKWNAEASKRILALIESLNIYLNFANFREVNKRFSTEIFISWCTKLLPLYLHWRAPSFSITSFPPVQGLLALYMLNWHFWSIILGRGVRLIFSLDDNRTDPPPLNVYIYITKLIIWTEI